MPRAARNFLLLGAILAAGCGGGGAVGGADLAAPVDASESQCPPPGESSSIVCLMDPRSNPTVCGCAIIGYRCTYPEQVLECACDHLYHCASSVTGCADGGAASDVVCDGGG